MAKDYLIGEGNKIGRLPSEFGADGSLSDKKLIAGANITKGQVVVLSDALTVIPSADASKFVLGVAMFDAKSGEAVSVECEGLMKLTAVSAITAPALIESAADGKVATVGDTVTKTIGIAITDASTDGDVYVKFSL